MSQDVANQANDASGFRTILLRPPDKVFEGGQIKF
jgi:hypothetical protein